MAGNYGIDLISMIAPTSKERIRKIAKGAKGFLYVVSSMGVTGERTNITTDIGGMLKEIRSVSSVPAAVGFGIHTPDQAAEISKTADGVIVGSAVVKLIAKYGSHAGGHLYTYVRMMKDAVSHSK